MTQDWTQQTQTMGDTQHTVHAAVCKGDSEEAVKTGLETALEKAVSLLDSNVSDESRYLLCEWKASERMLMVVVSDDRKMMDAPGVVQCRFAEMDESVDVELVQFLIRDYLTTCTAFLGWSLLAAFHEGDRQACRLL